MTPAPALLSIQVGPPRSYGDDAAANAFDRPWTTGIYKQAVAGPVTVHRTFVEGDGQADDVNHGGADKSICAYSADHYEHWRQHLDLAELAPGAFGENFTLAGITERDVCIGDSWAIGDLVVQVSQPRQPCWKLARKWRIKDFADQVIASGRTGWYFRVLEPAQVRAGDHAVLVARPHPEWTIAEANRAMYARPFDLFGCAALAAVPLLSAAWQRTLNGRLAKPA
jgi:MOSC domain-containing protein YiiM